MIKLLFIISFSLLELSHRHRISGEFRRFSNMLDLTGAVKLNLQTRQKCIIESRSLVNESLPQDHAVS